MWMVLLNSAPWTVTLPFCGLFKLQEQTHSTDIIMYLLFAIVTKDGTDSKIPQLWIFLSFTSYSSFSFEMIGSDTPLAWVQKLCGAVLSPHE